MCSEKVQNCCMATEVQWSELQRDPTRVAELADKGDVRVRRRDGAALLLTREDRIADSDEGVMSAGRALRNLLAHVPADVAAAAMTDEFPWVDVLPVEDRQQFAADFVRAFRASAELGNWSVLAQTLREWRATAAVHAEPGLAAALSEPLSDQCDYGPVPAPVEA